MNKIFFIIISIILIISKGNLYSQTGPYNISNINNYPTDKVDRISDMCFFNSNTGYLTAVWYDNISYPNKSYGYLYKTTNSGLNWAKQWRYEFPNVSSGKLTVSFSNANTGYFIKQFENNRFLRTTDGGINYTEINFSPNFIDNNYEPVTSINSNSDLFLIRKSRKDVIKIFNSGLNHSTHSFIQGIELFHIEVSKTNNVIYVCGRKHPDYYPFLAKSTDGGSTYSTILDFDGNQDTYYTGSLFHMSIINNGSTDFIKISGTNKLIEYNTVSNSITVLTSTWAEKRKISFNDMNNGFYMNNDFLTDDPPVELGISALYMTTNNGQSWLPVFTSTIGTISYPNRFYSYGNVAYFSQSDDVNKKAYFYTRNLNSNFRTFFDNQSVTGSFIFNGTQQNTPSDAYYRGGVYPVWSEPILNSGQTNERIFYKWSDNSYNNSVSNYNFIYDGILGNYFKTKLISDRPNAISNPTQTKAIRDTNGTINQIHESMGGIFYSRSTNSGTNWINEEAVNGSKEYLQMLPNDKTANNNSSPAICELRNLIQYGNPFTGDYSNQNIGAVWQRYNPVNQKIEIKSAIRTQTTNYGFFWRNYGNNIPYNNGIFKEFSSNSDYNSKPSIFASWLGANYSIYDPNDYLILIPHLEPSTNGNKLIVTAKCRGYSTVDNINSNSTNNNFLIDDNVTDFSVTAIPTRNYSIANGYRIYFAYIKNNEVHYQADIISIETSYGNAIVRESFNNNENISVSDNQQTRTSPDISLRNGRPVIAYRGYKAIRKEVIIGGGNNNITMTVYDHPIIVRYKYLNNSSEVWSTPTFFGSGGHIQDNPNID